MADEDMRDDVDAEEVERDQYLVFTVKSQEFGIQAMRVQEIAGAPTTTEMPNAPAYMEGVMNLRGRLASVINLRKRLNFEAKGRDEDTRIVIVEHGGYPIGVVVDSVEEVIKIDDSQVQALPESSSASVSEEYVTGVGMLDDRLIILLDIERILSKSELPEPEAFGQVLEQAAKAPEKAEGEVTDAVTASAHEETHG